jgi:biopolymer transport protein ExbD
MRIRTRPGHEEAAIPLTSMMDIVFLLLLFYMVTTTSFDQERALELELPGAQSAEELPPEELVISVLADGRIFLAQDELSQPELLARLRSAARAAPDTPVTIRGDRAARHETIVSVLDACGLAGLRNLSVGTTREERG